jgi:3-phosphoglycerate kinase
MSFRSLNDADVKGKRVLVRVDLNVPMHDGEVADVSRIERNAPTIIEIADRGGKVVLLSHYGRPKGPDPKESLKPVVAAVARIIKRPIAFAEDCVGPIADKAVAALKPGEILCLENTRFHNGEEKTTPLSPRSLPSSEISMWTMRSPSPTGRTPRSRPSRICCPRLRDAPCRRNWRRWKKRCIPRTVP